MQTASANKSSSDVEVKILTEYRKHGMKNLDQITDKAKELIAIVTSKRHSCPTIVAEMNGVSFPGKDVAQLTPQEEMALCLESDQCDRTIRPAPSRARMLHKASQQAYGEPKVLVVLLPPNECTIAVACVDDKKSKPQSTAPTTFKACRLYVLNQSTMPPQAQQIYEELLELGEENDNLEPLDTDNIRLKLQLGELKNPPADFNVVENIKIGANIKAFDLQYLDLDSNITYALEREILKLLSSSKTPKEQYYEATACLAVKAERSAQCINHLANLPNDDEFQECCKAMLEVPTDQEKIPWISLDEQSVGATVGEKLAIIMQKYGIPKAAVKQFTAGAKKDLSLVARTAKNPDGSELDEQELRRRMGQYWVNKAKTFVADVSKWYHKMHESAKKVEVELAKIASQSQPMSAEDLAKPMQSLALSPTVVPADVTAPAPAILGAEGGVEGSLHAKTPTPQQGTSMGL